MKDLKCIILKEYSVSKFDGFEYFLINWSNDPKMIKETVEEVINHVTNWDLENVNDYFSEDDVAQILKDYNQKELTSDYFKNLNFYGGGLGYETLVYEEGENIPNAIIDFYNEYFLDEDLDNLCCDCFEDLDDLEDIDDDESYNRIISIKKLIENHNNEELLLNALNELSNRIDECWN